MLEGAPSPQDHFSISDMSFTDSSRGRSMLGGISASRVWALTNLADDAFTPAALEEFGCPDGALTIAEGLDVRVRHNFYGGKWHPLHAGLVRTLLPVCGFPPSYMFPLVHDRKSETYCHPSGSRRYTRDGQLDRGPNAFLGPYLGGIC